MKLPKTKLLPHYHGKPFWENGIGYLVDNRGIRLPGVTSIMQATKSPLQKAQLTRWRQKVGSYEANRIIQASKKRGTIIHELVSKHLLGQPYSCPDFVRPDWDNLLLKLDNIDNIRLIEGNLFHYYLGYAGRVDCVANYLGMPCVIEFKSAERLKPLYDEPLQLAAYCGAVNRQRTSVARRSISSLGRNLYGLITFKSTSPHSLDSFVVAIFEQILAHHAFFVAMLAFVYTF